MRGVYIRRKILHNFATRPDDKRLLANRTPKKWAAPDHSDDASGKYVEKFKEREPKIRGLIRAIKPKRILAILDFFRSIASDNMILRYLLGKGDVIIGHKNSAPAILEKKKDDVRQRTAASDPTKKFTDESLHLYPDAERVAKLIIYRTKDQREQLLNRVVSKIEKVARSKLKDDTKAR